MSTFRDLPGCHQRESICIGRNQAALSVTGEGVTALVDVKNTRSVTVWIREAIIVFQDASGGDVCRVRATVAKPLLWVGEVTPVHATCLKPTGPVDSFGIVADVGAYRIFDDRSHTMHIDVELAERGDGTALVLGTVTHPGISDSLARFRLAVEFQDSRSAPVGFTVRPGGRECYALEDGESLEFSAVVGVLPDHTASSYSVASIPCE